MTREDVKNEMRLWRVVVRRVRWVTLSITFAAAVIANAVVVGYYARDFEARIETVESRSLATERELAAIDALHRNRMRSIERRQQTADQLAARLEERLIAIQATQEAIQRAIERLAK